MKSIRYIGQSLAIMLVLCLLSGLSSCSDDSYDLSTGTLINSVIKDVSTQDSKYKWNVVTQAKVGTKIRIEGGNLLKVHAVAFNGLDVPETNFVKHGDTYIEVVIPQTTPLANEVSNPDLRNTISLKGEDNTFVYSFSILSWKFSLTGVRTFANSNDNVGQLISTAEIGTTVQLEGTDLNSVETVYFNGFAVTVPSDAHLASTAIRITIPENTPLTDEIVDRANDENKIRVVNGAGESYTYQFKIIGPQISLDPTVKDGEGNVVTLIKLDSDIVLTGSKLNLVNELWLNGTKIDKFTATDNSIKVHVPADLPVGEDNVADISQMNTIKLISTYSQAVITAKIYGNAASPFISSVSHTLATAGHYIYIWGRNFEDISAIIFPGDVSATDFTVIDVNTIKVKVPEGGDKTAGYITVVGAGVEGYSYNDINCSDCKFLKSFSWGDSYGGSGGTTVNGTSTGMSGNQSAAYPSTNDEEGPIAPSCYRLVPSSAKIELASTLEADITKIYIKHAFYTSVANASNGLITTDTPCTDLAIEFDIYMTTDWTTGAFRWETGYNGNSEGEGRYTYLPWADADWKFYGGWRTIVIPLSTMSVYNGNTVGTINKMTKMGTGDSNTLYFKMGNFMGSDGAYHRGTTMSNWQLGFGDFRLVPYTKPSKK
jgi:hypothetical protein